MQNPVPHSQNHTIRPTAYPFGLTDHCCILEAKVPSEYAWIT